MDIYNNFNGSASNSEADEPVQLHIKDDPNDADFDPNKIESSEHGQTDLDDVLSEEDTYVKQRKDKDFINDDSDPSVYEDSDDECEKPVSKRIKKQFPSPAYNLRSKNRADEDDEAESRAKRYSTRLRVKEESKRRYGTRASNRRSSRVANLYGTQESDMFNSYGDSNLHKSNYSDGENEGSKLNHLNEDKSHLQVLFRNINEKKDGEKIQKNVILPDNLEIINDDRLKLLSEGDRMNSYNLNKKPVTWNQFGGLKKQIQTLNQTLVLPTKYKALYESINLKPENGFLFYGPPGTGKTMVAQALANDTSSNGKPWAFFFRNSTEFLSKYYGDGEKSLTLLFETARKWAPSIIYLDEIDALAPSRIESEETHLTAMVSTLLGLMDGAVEREGVVVIASTNHPETIDPALRRPGRFGTELLFTLPDHYSRMEVFSKITQTWPVPPSSDLIDWLATRTNGYTPADIKLVCNESLLQAKIQSSLANRVSDQPLQVTKAHFELSLATFVPTGRRALSMDVFPLPFYQSWLLQSEVDYCCQWFSPYLQPPTVSPLVPQLPKSLVLHGATPYVLSSIGSAVLNQLAVDRILTLSASDLVRQSDGITVPQALKRQLASIPMHPIAFTTSVIYIPFVDSSPRIFNQVISILNMYLKHLSPLCQVVLLVTSNTTPGDFGYDFLQAPQAEVHYVKLSPSDEQRSNFLINLLEASFASKLPKPDKESLFRGRFSPPNPKSANSLILNDHSTRSDLVIKDLIQMLHGCFQESAFKLLMEPMYTEGLGPPDVEPMCLLKVLDKITAYQYETFDQVLKDLNTIVNNVIFYFKDPTHFVVQTALQLEYDIYHNLGAKYTFVFDQYKEVCQNRLERFPPPEPIKENVDVGEDAQDQELTNGHANGSTDHIEDNSNVNASSHLEGEVVNNQEHLMDCANGASKTIVQSSVTLIENIDDDIQISQVETERTILVTSTDCPNPDLDMTTSANHTNPIPPKTKLPHHDTESKCSIAKLLAPDSPNDISSTCFSTTSTCYHLPNIIEAWHKKEFDTDQDEENPNSVHYLNLAHGSLMQNTQGFSIVELLDYSCCDTLANAASFKDLWEQIKE